MFKTSRRSFFGIIGALTAITTVKAVGAETKHKSSTKLYNFGSVDGVPVKEFVFPKGKAVTNMVFSDCNPDHKKRLTILVPSFTMSQKGYVISRRGEPDVGDFLTPNPPKWSVKETILRSIQCNKEQCRYKKLVSNGSYEHKRNVYTHGHETPIVFLLRDEERGEIGIAVMDGNKNWKPIYSTC